MEVQTLQGRISSNISGHIGVWRVSACAKQFLPEYAILKKVGMLNTILNMTIEIIVILALLTVLNETAL